MLFTLSRVLIFILVVLEPIHHVVSNDESKMLLLADFTSSSSNYREMRTLDDPAMGGSSASIFTIKENDCLVWEGEVKIVSFLDTPGFCILETARRQDFVGIGETSGISFIVRSKEYRKEVNMLLPMAAGITTGSKTSFGYLVTYVGILYPKRKFDGLMELYAPWTAFKPNFRGQEVDAPPLTAEELERTYRVGLSTYTSHKAGKFHVEILKIIAY